LLDYMTSEDFLCQLSTPELKILDIGCGPAVASLAITDLLACILRHLRNTGWRLNIHRIRASYVLNDTANICLGTGQELLGNYHRLSTQHQSKLVHVKTLTVEKDFPFNMTQLKRICQNIGAYNIVI